MATGVFQQLITLSAISSKEGVGHKKTKGKRCGEWRQEGRKSACCRIAFSVFADRAGEFA